jgi:hypothetical protein
VKSVHLGSPKSVFKALAGLLGGPSMIMEGLSVVKVLESVSFFYGAKSVLQMGKTITITKRNICIHMH